MRRVDGVVEEFARKRVDVVGKLYGAAHVAYA
jgi:hypothetical protein